MTQPLYVTNGDATAGLMREAGLPGEHLPWRDVLHEGPVPALPLRELSRVRARFIAGRGWGAPDEVHAQFVRRDDVLVGAARFERIALWFEHDLFDQLQLLQLLAWLAEAATSTALPPLHLMNIGSFPGRPDFAGLGELTATELGSLRAHERPLDAATLALGARAFAAFTAPTLAPLGALLATDLTPLPFLRAALVRLCQEVPWRRDGLGRTQRQLLTAVAPSGGDLRRMFLACGAAEEARFLGDVVFLDHARALASGPSPALTPVDGWRRRVALTAFGERLLAGDADLVASCGVDRWLGGIHLVGDRYRYDEARGQLVDYSA